MLMTGYLESIAEELYPLSIRRCGRCKARCSCVSKNGERNFEHLWADNLMDYVHSEGSNTIDVSLDFASLDAMQKHAWALGRCPDTEGEESQVDAVIL